MRISLIVVLLAGFTAAAAFAQEANNQVHFNIPGNNQINTEETIQKFLMIKKIPIQKKEAEIQDFKLENDIVKDLTKYLRDLDEKSEGALRFQIAFQGHGRNIFGPGRPRCIR